MKPETLAFLKQHGQEIGQKAAQGDILCRRIVHLYQMYLSWNSDPGSLGLLEASVQEYRNHTASLPKRNPDMKFP